MPTVPAPASDVASLVARLLLGIVLVAHGWQKLAEKGVAAVAGAFAGMDIPLPAVSAVFATSVELGGGVLVLLGLATPYAAVLVTLTMVGAGVFAGHWTGGVFVAGGGWELVGVIITGALMLLAFGPGRYSLDHLLNARRRADEPEGRHARRPESERVSAR